MPVFTYKAINAVGKVVKGNIDSESSVNAKKQLRKKSLFVTQISELHIKRKTNHNFLSVFSIREKTSQLASITRQLATLLSAGLPLLRTLSAIIEQMDSGEIKDILSSVRDSIRGGETFASSLAKFPQFFPSLMINMIDAGESGGALDITMLRLADYYEGKVALRNKIRATMAYPIFMVVVGTGVLIFLFIFLIPRVTSIFTQMKAALPLSTRSLIAISNAAQSFWYLFPILLVILFFLFKHIKKNEEWMKRIDEKKLKLPLVGNLFLKLAVARFARTLGTLLTGGVSLFQALYIVRNIVNNRYLANIIEEIREKVGEGASLTMVMKEKKIFPPVFFHMVAVGEETGELEKMMVHIADTFESEVEQAVTALTALLEPVMILVMGAVVGLVVISILLPIFEMSQIVK